MKQKMVMSVHISSEKRRTQALKIAAGFTGVRNISVDAEKDQLVVIGDRVDPVCLVKSLRKKLCHAEIVSVEVVKEPEEEKKPDAADTPFPIQYWTSSYLHYPMHSDVVYRW